MCGLVVYWNDSGKSKYEEPNGLLGHSIKFKELHSYFECNIKTIHAEKLDDIQEFVSKNDVGVIFVFGFDFMKSAGFVDLDIPGDLSERIESFCGIPVFCAPSVYSVNNLRELENKCINFFDLFCYYSGIVNFFSGDDVMNSVVFIDKYTTIGNSGLDIVKRIVKDKYNIIEFTDVYEFTDYCKRNKAKNVFVFSTDLAQNLYRYSGNVIIEPGFAFNFFGVNVFYTVGVESLINDSCLIPIANEAFDKFDKIRR